MTTTTDIKKRATTLSQKKAPNSITPEEVGGLFYDLAETVEDNETSGGVGKATSQGGEIFNNYGSNKASAPYAHAEGSGTQASGNHSHAEGNTTSATGENSHAEGSLSGSTGACSHAEGYDTTASGRQSHAEGYKTGATGDNSHAEGEGTQTTNSAEHAEGRYNKSNSGTRHSIGIGVSDSSRKNAVEAMDDGRVYVNGIGGYDGTNPQEEGVKTIQEMLSVLPDKEQTIRNFMSCENKTAAQLSIIKEIYKLLLAGAVGFCQYDKSTVPDPAASTVSNVSSVTYYDKVKKIYADYDGVVYEDWIYADAYPYSMSSKDFLADSNNTPITGKLYLMHDADNHMGIWYWNGTAMISLIDFDRTEDRISELEERTALKIKMETKNEGSQTPLQVILENDVIILEKTGEADLTFSYITQNVISGHRTTIYLHNASAETDENKYGAFIIDFSSDENINVHVLNAAEKIWVAPGGYVRIDAVYTEQNEEKDLYLTLERSEGGSKKESGTKTTVLRPFYDKIETVYNNYALDFDYTPEVGHVIDIVLSNSVGGNLKFKSNWDVYGAELDSSGQYYLPPGVKINLRVKYKQDGRYDCLITGPTHFTETPKSISVIENSKSLDLNNDIIYDEITNDSFANTGLQNAQYTLPSKNGHITDIYIHTTADRTRLFDTFFTNYGTNVIKDFKGQIYLAKDETIRITAVYFKEKGLFFSYKRSWNLKFGECSITALYPLYDIINLTSFSGTIGFPDGWFPSEGQKIILPVKRSDSQVLSVDFPKKWDVYGAEISDVGYYNRMRVVGPCDVIMTLICVDSSTEKCMVLIEYRDLTPATENI